MTTLIAGLRKKFTTPQQALKALGLDEALLNTKENLKMTTRSVSQRERAMDALTAYLAPKLAKDAKLDEGLNAILFAFDAESEEKEEKEEKKEEAKDKKAKDEEAPEKKPEGVDKKAKDKKAKDKKAMDDFKEKLKDKMSAEDWKAACDEIDGMDEEKDEEDENPDPEKTNKGDKKAKDGISHESMTKAMDEAIAGERKRQRDVREAERFVRPWIGDLKIAYDSADDVYKAALESRGKPTKGIHPSAYRTILEMLPKPGTEARTASTRVAMDASGKKSFAEFYPGAMNIKISA